MEARALQRHGGSVGILATACIAIAMWSTSCGGGATEAIPVSINNPVPAITSLSPGSATAGTGLQTLTINGINFLSTSAVSYNGVGHAATFVNSGQLTIQLNASDQATAGTYAVVVTNPAPGGGPSNSVNFTVTGPSASLSPSSYVFPSQPAATSSSAQTFTLSNTGNATLQIAGIGFTGANAGDFSQTTTCGATLTANSSCTIAAVFTPATGGSRNASLTVTENSNGISGSTQSSTLTGIAIHDVILSWAASASSGIVGYNVYRGTASGAESSYPVEFHTD